jgi:hypothetical protein
MLVLPELFVPKSPVIGANRIPSIDFHDLKFVADSLVIIEPTLRTDVCEFARDRNHSENPQALLHIDVTWEKIQPRAVRYRELP